MKEDMLKSFDESMKHVVQNISGCCDSFLNASSSGTKAQSRLDLLGALEVFKNFMDLRDKIEKDIADKS